MFSILPVSFSLMGRGISKTGLLILVYLALIGCAQFNHQLPDEFFFVDRSQTKSDDEVRVTVAVPSAEESEQIFGFPLAGKNIQPVWLEVGSGYLFVRRSCMEVSIQPLYQKFSKKYLQFIPQQRN